MKALILAAGYATRLYPLTKDFPKPLLEVSKKPIIDHILAKLQVLPDIDQIFVVTNNKFIPHFRKWEKKLRGSKRVFLVNDLTRTIKTRRGAIGDMNFVINKKGIRDDLLVVGGDNLFSEGLERFVSFARAKKNPVIGVYNIKKKSEAGKYGVIKLGRQNRLLDFKEKPQDPDSALIAMCLYYFPRKKIGLVKQYLESKTDKRDATGFYIDWLRKKEKVFGFVFGGIWYDIGDRKFLKEADKRFSA
ncbi:MAG: nucleotidyltransferase family protein [Candidatus Omnitrophica bacterium]|nr:nucleotidyltransferase family protein [Candidatus Omnitrophota bacterium]MDD5553311.1 nucleotidyltransferase family protein [Candidatus Omnitrophota bacterium]